MPGTESLRSHGTAVFCLCFVFSLIILATIERAFSHVCSLFIAVLPRLVNRTARHARYCQCLLLCPLFGLHLHVPTMSSHFTFCRVFCSDLRATVCDFPLAPWLGCPIQENRGLSNVCQGQECVPDVYSRPAVWYDSCDIWAFE